MATPSKRKRKDTPSSNTPSKRLSKVRGADKAEPSPVRRRKARQAAVANPDKLWTVRSIQAEKGNKYLIDWEDDPVTGESYAPTWEPKANANKGAVDHWERQKRRKATTASPAPVSTPAPAPALATAAATAYTAGSTPSRKRHRKSKSKSESEQASASSLTTNVAADDPSSQEPPSKRARLSVSVERERDHRNHRKRHTHSSGPSPRPATSEAAPAEPVLAAEPSGSQPSLPLENHQEKSEIEDSYILEEVPNTAELRVPIPQANECRKSSHNQFSSAFLSSQTQQSLCSPTGPAPIATEKESPVQVIRSPQSDHYGRLPRVTFDPEGTIPDSQSVQEAPSEIVVPKNTNNEAVNAAIEERGDIVPSTSPVNSESASDCIVNLSVLADRAHASESSEVFNSSGTSPPSSSDTFTATEEASKATTEGNSESSSHPQPNGSGESSIQTSDSSFQSSANSINQSELDNPREPSQLTTDRSLHSTTDISCQDQDAESNAPSKPTIDKSSSTSAESTITHTAGDITLEHLGQEGHTRWQTEGPSEERSNEKAGLVGHTNEGDLIQPSSSKPEIPQPTETLRPIEASQPTGPPKTVEVPQQARLSDQSEVFPPAETPQPVGPPKLVETPQLADVPQPTEILQPVESSQQAELSGLSEVFPSSEPISQPAESSRTEELPRLTEPPLVAGILQQVERSEPPETSQPIVPSEQVETWPAEGFQPLDASQQVESPELVENSQPEGDSLSVVAPQPTESSELAELSRPRGYPQRAAEAHSAEAPETPDNLPPVQPPQRTESPQPLETHHPVGASLKVETPTSAETQPTETLPPPAEAPQREYPQPIETPLPAEVPQPREDILPLGAFQLLETSQPVEDEPPHPPGSHQPVETQQTDHPHLVEAPHSVGSPLPTEPPQLVVKPQPAEALHLVGNPPPAGAFQQVEPTQIVESPQSAETSQQIVPFQPAESHQNIEPSLLSETPQLTEQLQPVGGLSGVVQGTDTANSGESGYYQAAQKVSQSNPAPSLVSEEPDIDQDIIFQTQISLALSIELGARRPQSEERVVVSSHQIETQSGESAVSPIPPIYTTSHSLDKGLEADQPVNLAEGVTWGSHSEESAIAPILSATTGLHRTEEGVNADQPQNPSEDTWQAAQVVSPFVQPISQILTNDDDVAGSQPGVNQRLQGTVKPPGGHPIEIHQDEGSRSLVAPSSDQISPSGLLPETLSPLVHAPPEAEKIAQIVDHEDPRVVPSAAEGRISEPLQDLRSSPLPLPLTHPIDRYDISPPSQSLQASSDESMSDGIQPISSPSGGLTLREKLNNLRANTAAKRVIREESRLRSARSTVSPVVITEAQAAAQAQPTNTKTETISPSRSPRVKSPTLLRPNDLPVHKELSSQVASSVAVANLGKMEFVVPLPMNARVRDQYQQIVYNYRKEIETFMRAENESNDEALASQMKEMLGKVSKVAIHPDLDSNDTIALQGAPEEDEAKWSENCSTKFEFLRRFLEAIRYQKLHVAILAQSKRLLDILELFLKATRFKFNRPDRPDNSRMELNLKFPGQMTVTLQETGESGATYVASDAQLIITFDRTFNPHDRHVEIMRNHPFIVGKKCPVFHLLIQNSVEHADMCIPSTLDEEQRLQTTVYLVTQARRDVGVLPPEYPSPTLAADKLARWLLDGGEVGKWPLPSLGSIRGVEFLMDSQASDSQQILQGMREPPDNADDVQNGQKRPLVDENNDSLGPQKKPRPEVFSPVQNTVPGAELPRISDSNPHPPQAPNLALATINEGNGKATRLLDETHPATDAAVGVGRPESQLQSRSARPQKQVGREAEIQQEARSIERRLRDYIENFTELQTKYEGQVQEIRSLRAERDDALAVLKQTGIRRDQMTAEILKQKEGRASVEALLKQARADLIGSSRPGVAELAKAREEARKEMIERRHLEQKVESMTRELDFFRAQYQEASSAAAEAGAEVHILRDEIEILKKKASGEAVKLRQMAISTENERHSRRILELEATLKERDEHLRRKEEEMKSQARGKGVVMRASSAPKSPKPSRAGSPNPLTGSVPTTVVTVPAANNGGYGPIPGVGAVGRGGGHPLRYSGHPLPME